MVTGCAVPVRAKRGPSCGQEMLRCPVRFGLTCQLPCEQPRGGGTEQGWVQGRVSVGAAWVTLPAAPGHGHEDVKPLGVCPGCVCCRRAAGHGDADSRQRARAARPPPLVPTCAALLGRGELPAGLGAALGFGCPSCWPRRSC